METDRVPRLAVTEFRRDVDVRGARWLWFRFEGQNGHGGAVHQPIKVPLTGDRARDEAAAW